MARQTGTAGWERAADAAELDAAAVRADEQALIAEARAHARRPQVTVVAGRTAHAYISSGCA